MNPIRQTLRVVKINFVLLRNGLDEIVLDINIFRPIRFLLYLTPWYWLRRTKLNRGARIRVSLEQLGPIFVKFGQILSTRQDLLPPDIVEELSLLQDRVPSFPVAKARALMEAAFGDTLERVFAEFDDTPLASASIAQVHAARLHDGSEVVVKVVRPGIEKTIRQDIDLLYVIADLAERYWATGKRLRPREVVAEFEKNLFDELDLQREAANASQLRRNFAGSPLLYVPDIHWPLTRQNVMVMERIRGVPISHIQTLAAAKVDFKVLAERGVEIFFTQVFRHSFFHADMHPGNIFVDVSNPQLPRYIAIDFGIMGTLNPMDQNYLAQNFLAFFNRDYRRVAELHVESGWVPPNTRVDEFESAIRTVCEPIFERPLSEISFGALLLRLFQTARRFNMEVQPQLVLLQKTLLNIEGLGRQLYPELDLWATAKPFLERWMSEQVGVRSVLRLLKKNLPVWGQVLPELPGLLHATLQQITHGQVKFDHQAKELRALRRELHRSQKIQTLALVGSCVGIAALLVAAPVLGTERHLPWLAGALAAVCGVWLLNALQGARD